MGNNYSAPDASRTPLDNVLKENLWTIRNVIEISVHVAELMEELHAKNKCL